MRIVVLALFLGGCSADEQYMRAQQECQREHRQANSANAYAITSREEATNLRRDCERAREKGGASEACEEAKKAAKVANHNEERAHVARTSLEDCWRRNFTGGS